MKPDGIYQAITTEADLKDLVYVINEFNYDVAIDTETSSVDPFSCELYGISISYKPGFACYIPVKRHLSQMMLWDNPSEFLPIEILQQYLHPIFFNESKKKILHNAKFDMHVLERHGFYLVNPVYDTMIGAWILGNKHGVRYGLKDLVDKKLGFQMTTFKEVVGKKKNFSEVPLPDAVKYAAADADMTLRLHNMIEDVFPKYPSLLPTRELEMPIVRVLKDMEAVGALIDKSYLESLNKPLKRQMNLYSKMVYDTLGEFNINSGEQLKDKLNKHCHLRLEDTQFETLIKHKDENLVIDSYLRYAKRQKLQSVYVEGILKLLDKDDRVHTEFRQNKKTGRLSSNNPNAQNIPTKKDEDEYAKDLPEIRKAFIADPGCKIVSIDYSQLELRITAHRANEPAWIEAFNKNVDIHKATAAAVLKIPISKVTKEQRFRAKAINFGLLYGMSEYGLSKRINVSIDEAREFINTYFENLPMVRKYIEDRKAEVRGRRYVETEIGRRLYFSWDTENPKSLPAAEREAVNMPIQGQSADIVKKAMVEIHKNILTSAAYETKMILQVHDELDFSMPLEEMPILIPQILEIMQGVYTLSVPLVCDVEVGDNWQDLKDWS